MLNVICLVTGSDLPSQLARQIYPNNFIEIFGL